MTWTIKMKPSLSREWSVVVRGLSLEDVEEFIRDFTGDEPRHWHDKLFGHARVSPGVSRLYVAECTVD